MVIQQSPIVKPPNNMTGLFALEHGKDQVVGYVNSSNGIPEFSVKYSGENRELLAKAVDKILAKQFTRGEDVEGRYNSSTWIYTPITDPAGPNIEVQYRLHPRSSDKKYLRGKIEIMNTNQAIDPEPLRELTATALTEIFSNTEQLGVQAAIEMYKKQHAIADGLQIVPKPPVSFVDRVLANLGMGVYSARDLN